MLVKKGSTRIKLIDYGLARILDPTTPIKVKYGSAEYTSPEVLNDEPVSKATDMWTLGVITYILLCGESPFVSSEDDPHVLRENIRKGDWSFDDVLFDEVSEEAKDFISKLIVKEQG